MHREIIFSLIGIAIFSTLLVLPMPAYSATQTSNPTYAPIKWIQTSELLDIPNDCPQGLDEENGGVGDGICDSWETGGDMVVQHLGETYTYVCPNPQDQNCPSPETVDIFVEIDYMEGHRPSDQAIELVKTAFRDNGIELHVQLDEEAASFVSYSFWPGYDYPWPGYEIYHGFDQIKEVWLGTDQERSQPDWYSNGWKIKTQLFHYGLFLHTLYGQGCTSGVAEIHGNDFAVTLGCFEGGVGSIDQQAGSLMHELGHNLALRHGGVDDINCKPNYLSVMSYSRQFSDYINNRPLDYSPQKLSPPGSASLNEANLVEDSGLDSAHGEMTVWWGFDASSVMVDMVSDNMDWNGMPPASETVSGDVNKFGGCDGTGSNLVGHNDWSNLQLKIIDNPGTASHGAGPAGNEERRYIGAEKLSDDVLAEFPRVLSSKELSDLLKHRDSGELANFPGVKMTASDIAEANKKVQEDYTKRGITPAKLTTADSKEITSEIVKEQRLSRLNALEHVIKKQEAMKTDSKEAMNVTKDELLTSIRESLEQNNLENTVNQLEELLGLVKDEKAIQEIKNVKESHEIAQDITFTDVHTKYGQASCHDLDAEINKVVTFPVRYCIVNGEVNATSVDKNSKSLTINIQPTASDGQITTKFQRDWFDADKDFVVNVDDKKITPKELKDMSTKRSIPIQFSETDSKIVIKGTKLNAPNIISPRAQEKADVNPDDVFCKPGLELIIKTSTGQSACVLPDTAAKLKSRGW